MATLHAIDYDSNIERLKNFLKSDVKFKDINFEASGIKTLINMLAYNAHYLGVYAYMLNNESSIDSAQLEQSVFSHARGLGYTPKGVRSSRAEVVITQDLQTFPERGYVVLNRFKTITGTSHRDADSRFFSNPDDVYLYQWVQNPDTTYTFTSKPTVLIEGTYRTWKFQVDASVQYQSFIIKDKTIDIDSLRVFVKKSANDDGIVYQLAKNVFETNATKLKGNLTLKFANNKSSTFQHFTSELTTYKGYPATISIFIADKNGLANISNSNITMALLQLSNDVYQTVIVKMNGDILKKHYNCLK